MNNQSNSINYLLLWDFSCRIWFENSRHEIAQAKSSQSTLGKQKLNWMQNRELENSTIKILLSSDNNSIRYSRYLGNTYLLLPPVFSGTMTKSNKNFSFPLNKSRCLSFSFIFCVSKYLFRKEFELILSWEFELERRGEGRRVNEITLTGSIHRRLPIRLLVLFLPYLRNFFVSSFGENNLLKDNELKNGIQGSLPFDLSFIKI